MRPARPLSACRPCLAAMLAPETVATAIVAALWPGGLMLPPFQTANRHEGSAEVFVKRDRAAQATNRELGCFYRRTRNIDAPGHAGVFFRLVEVQVGYANFADRFRRFQARWLPRRSAWQPEGRAGGDPGDFGVNHHIRSVCDRFAALGYASVAPAVFDRMSPNFES